MKKSIFDYEFRKVRVVSTDGTVAVGNVIHISSKYEDDDVTEPCLYVEMGEDIIGVRQSMIKEIEIIEPGK